MGIYVNQIGYRSDAEKIAVTTKDGTYHLLLENQNGSAEVVAELKGSPCGLDAESGDEIWQLDFSSVQKTGKYWIQRQSEDDIIEKSVSFEIKQNIYEDLLNVLCKCFYYQRCGCELKAEHAGIYTHKACHQGKSILYADYANKTVHPTGYDMQGGWHDAGDFGRYSTAAAVALGHLLYAYELFPETFSFSMNIPESGNGIPDILNECRYELDWLIKMQTPDGGVYHKLTAYRHAPFIMPEEDQDPFLLYPVSSMAVADYVAIMAAASRIYEPFDKVFSQKALQAARKSFVWLLNHEYVGFENPKGSGTGEYDDACDTDERLWAAAEMLRSDKNGDVYTYRNMLEKCLRSDMKKTDFGWVNVAGFSILALLTDPDHCAGDKIEALLKNELFEEAERLCILDEESGYNLYMKDRDYVWGSNMVVLNRGMLLVIAGLLTDDEDKKKRFFQAAEDAMHYILGRNALDRSYVTGFGEKAYRNPHNRFSACDGIEDPMPGWVSGGPFRTPADEDAIRLIPKGTPPMKCHADVVGSYSTNEITIYWNSPAVFLTAFLCRNH